MEEENLRLQAEKQRLLARLALYTARQNGADTDGVVQRLFAVFDKNQRGEIDAAGFRQMAWILGEELSDAQAQACVARLDIDSSGGLSLNELQTWWASHDRASAGFVGKDSSDDTDGPLSVLLERLRSSSYVRMLLGWRERLIQESRQHADDHIFRLSLDTEVGQFGEARCSGSMRFSQDVESAAALRQELKAPDNCVGLISIGFTIRGDIDEFELGELAGSINNLLLLAKPFFKFHSHKTQMGRQNDERLMVVSLFWSDIDELVQLRSVLMGADLKEIEGTIELSQKPGDETEEFVMGRVKGKLAVGVNVVPFLNELFYEYKSDSFRAQMNLLATFRNLDLKLKLDDMEQAYHRLIANIEYFRGVSGMSSQKQLLFPIVESLYSDNSVPAPVKDTYFHALACLRGVASLHLQMDSQILRFTLDNADIAALLPTKDELTAWRAPPPAVSTARALPPLFGSNEYHVAVMGPPRVGKSALVKLYTQLYVVMHNSLFNTSNPLSSEALRTALRLVHLDNTPLTLGLVDVATAEGLQDQSFDAVALMYSVTDRSSFEAMEEWRKRILHLRNVPVMLLANKCDQSAERKVTTEEGEDLAAKWDDSLYFEISTSTARESHSAIFTELAHEIRAFELSAEPEWYAAV